ncbi:MAG: HAD family hydrolase [Meiothermus sp.]|nr:HAD family hydrolase [Meiothermus sp.]
MRWLTFDLDGTLADWPFRYIVQPHMRPLVENNPGLREALREEYQSRLGTGEPARIYDWGDIHHSVKQKLGLSLSFPDIPKLLEAATFEPGMVYGDVLEGLRAFKAQGWSVAVATNGLAKYQQPLVDRLEIPYDFMLAPDVSGATKPEVEFWDPLPRPRTRVVHVGDLLTHDIWGANAAGLGAVWIWREMPPAWRETPVEQRLARGDAREVIAALVERELEEHGFVGREMPGELPRPDHVVADLRELLEVV